MFFDLFYVMAGLLLLVGGSELAVEYTQRFARRIKMSELVIGLTILAFGSDIPELATNIKVGLALKDGLDNAGIAIGNILGSSLAQITLVAGICGLITTIYIDPKALVRDSIAMLSALALMLLAAIDGYISPTEGLMLCSAYIIYLFVLAQILSKTLSSDHTPEVVKKFLHFLHVRPIHEKDIAEEVKEPEEPPKNTIRTTLRDFVFIGLGLLAVVFGAEWVVSHGHQLAKQIGINDVLIGVFLGLGTSLPELAISVRALKKGATGISIGNLMGSNIVDPTLALGAGAMIAGFKVGPKVLYFEFPFLIVGTLTAILLFRDHEDLDRREAIILIMYFLLFIFLSIALFMPQSPVALAAKL